MFKGVFLGSLVAELLIRFPLCSSSFFKCNSFFTFEFIFVFCDNVQIDLCAETWCLSQVAELFPAKTGLQKSVQAETGFNQFYDLFDDRFLPRLEAGVTGSGSTTGVGNAGVTKVSTSSGLTGRAGWGVDKSGFGADKSGFGADKSGLRAGKSGLKAGKSGCRTGKSGKLFLAPIFDVRLLAAAAAAALFLFLEWWRLLWQASACLVLQMALHCSQA